MDKYCKCKDPFPLDKYGRCTNCELPSIHKKDEPDDLIDEYGDDDWLSDYSEEEN